MDFQFNEEQLEMRRALRDFAEKERLPHVAEWDEKSLFPMETIKALGELGFLGVIFPPEYGGAGLKYIDYALVIEELARADASVAITLSAHISLCSNHIYEQGTEEQKKEWLPRLAAGEVLSTAVFTEPNIGSDLAHLGTRAVEQGDGSYVLNGQKTWITHAARADLMTVLARTNADEPGYRGLSMFLASKTRRTGEGGEAEFVDEGLTGTEITVLGYRGMKEYELSFEDFKLPADSLLGGEEGAGFKQLMRTFESARIQTAARGVGVAQAALEDAILYATEREQFGGPIFQFPRVARKIGRMIVRIQAGRQMTYFSAREKDQEKRCDLQAGMAKLLATRSAWEAADANVQIHGGHGYAEEYNASRLLVDARVLSLFEGANEIQAHVVARRLLES